MDSTIHYQQLIRAIMQEHEALGTQDSFQPITTHFVYDDVKLEYLMLNVGQDTVWNRWIYAVIFHAWIQDGKIWVASDNISPSIVGELLERGVPQRDILSAQEQPFVRDVAATKEPA